jgi:hypothetical protein
MDEVEEIIIPYKPRSQQLEIHNALDESRFVVAVCHRRFGKSVMAINHLIREALRCDKPNPRTPKARESPLTILWSTQDR